MDNLVQRINELYHKSKKDGLSDEEKKEQTQLRKLYIENVKQNLTVQLDHIDIQNEDGTVENLGEKFGKTNH